MARELVNCTCGRTLRVRPDDAGRPVRCPTCRRVFLAPTDDPEAMTLAPGWQAPAPAPPQAEEERTILLEPVADDDAPQQPPPSRRLRRPRRVRRSRGPRWLVELAERLDGEKPLGVMLGALGLGAVLLVIALVTGKAAAKASAKAQRITLAQLAANGPGGNAHVLVTDYAACNNYVYRAMRMKNTGATGAWEAVYVPLVARDGPARPGLPLAGKVSGDQIRVIMYSTRARSADDVVEIFTVPEIEGTVIERTPSGDVERLLRQAYPGLDLGRCVVLEERRKPTDPVVPIFAAVVGTIFFLVGGLLLAVRALYGKRG